MQFINTGYTGQIGSSTVFNMVFLNTSEWVVTLQRNLDRLIAEGVIRLDEAEVVCAWCIRESVKRAFPEVRLLDHIFVDRYQLVYDDIFHQQEYVVRRTLMSELDKSFIVNCMRVLPMLDKTIVALGN